MIDKDDEKSVAEVWAVDSNYPPYDNAEPLRTTDEDPEPLLLQVLESYDPEHDSAGARVTRTDFLIAEAVTTLQSMVEGQQLEIQALKEVLAKLTTLQY